MGGGETEKEGRELLRLSARNIIHNSLLLCANQRNDKKASHVDSKYRFTEVRRDNIKYLVRDCRTRAIFHLKLINQHPRSLFKAGFHNHRK